MIGSMKRYFEMRGFGFIEPDDGSGEIFFHVTSVKNLERGQDPRIGDRMEFDRITAGDRRIRAVNVHLTRKENVDA
jgi:cold shock CspA family protein